LGLKRQKGDRLKIFLFIMSIIIIIIIIIEFV